MRSVSILITAIAICSFTFAQDLTKIALIQNNSYQLINAENQTGIVYVSLTDLADALSLPLIKLDKLKSVSLTFDSISVRFNVNNPFVTIYNNKDSILKTVQLSGSPYFKNESIYVSILTLVELINDYWDKELFQLAANRIKVVEKIEEEETLETHSVKIDGFSVETGDDYSLIKIFLEEPVSTTNSFYRSKNLHLLLWGTTIASDSILKVFSDDILEKIDIIKSYNSTEWIFSLKENETITEVYKGSKENELIVRINKREFGDWYIQESEHFKIIYRDSHSHLVTHLLSSAENSLNLLMKLFKYKPKGKIVLNTYDVNDFGYGATTTVPDNYVRLEIEPLEPGYEVVPYSERFQWLLSHELVHIVVNDMAGNFESTARSVFGKVNPDKNQPLSMLYSLLTNHNRYTPRWYQEAIAVFMETWFSGGYGRILGNFDEMYFRTLVNNKINFPSTSELENYTSHKTIFLENILYMYGARFVAHLSDKYGVKKLIEWFSLQPEEFYPGLESKFKDIYGVEFNSFWEEFVNNEIEFQRRNIETLKRYPLTDLNYLTNKSFGWVTKLTYDSKTNSILFGYHRPGELASIERLNLNKIESIKISTLPSPSIIQVSSLAYDEIYRQLFFTTNNNQLYRDLWMYDFNSDKEKLLFENARIGYLTSSPITHELWGIQHLSGKSILVKSKYPYTELQSLSIFNVGDELQDLSINRNGNLLAATLHRNTGQQSIIISDITGIEKGDPFKFRVVTSSGSPENPSWSVDGKYLYWNAYTNGVSNIYKYSVESELIIPLTNTIQGLFRPIEISQDSILAMEFTVDGFVPVTFKSNQTTKIPAINYFGQRILNKSPEIIDWNLKPAGDVVDQKDFLPEASYSTFKNIGFKTFIPVVSGFQSRIVLGFYTQLNDPLLIHDLIIEAGISPFKETTNDIKFHLRFKYSYEQKIIFSIEHNSQDFGDLINKRKRGMLGSRYSIGYSNYWVFDNPLKVKQTTELSFYKDIKFINDNLTEVKQPDFAILKSEIDIKNLRRTIGSIDWESGDQFKFSIMGYGSNPNDPEYSGQIMGEWDKYFITIADHNVLHLKFNTGYHVSNENLPETMFFFGGFGNREFENEPVKQYGKMFRFPGVPIYSIISDKFFKVMVENSFPPIRIPGASFWSVDLKNINLSVFSQVLYSDSPTIDKIVDLGGQLNIMFQHWYNLESTISAGVAKAWWRNGNDFEWFVSFKLFKD
ncbi:MAG: hypothetical protein WAU11_05070 [Ignavibacteriaceae bacterium]